MSPVERATTILVTGATDGIGREAARQLLERGARVVVHGRDAGRIARVVDELRRDHGASVLEPLCADFRSLDEVRAMVATLDSRGADVDVLVNNAGVFTNSPAATRDGFEATWAINHLAPFLLSHLMLNRPRAVSLRRIVFVSSDAHLHGSLDCSDPGGSRVPFNRLATYAGSKLATVVTMVEMARRLGTHGPTVNALHPGVVSTKLLVEGYGAQGPDSVEHAANQLVLTAVSPALDGVTGKYFDHGAPSRMAPAASDFSLTNRFYEASASAVGVVSIPPGGRPRI